MSDYAKTEYIKTLELNIWKLQRRMRHVESKINCFFCCTNCHDSRLNGIDRGPKIFVGTNTKVWRDEDDLLKVFKKDGEYLSGTSHIDPSGYICYASPVSDGFMESTLGKSIRKYLEEDNIWNEDK